MREQCLPPQLAQPALVLSAGPACALLTWRVTRPAPGIESGTRKGPLNEELGKMVARRSFRNSWGLGAEAGVLGELGEELEASSRMTYSACRECVRRELTAWRTWFPLAACRGQLLPIRAPGSGCPSFSSRKPRLLTAGQLWTSPNPQNHHPCLGPAAEGRPVGRQTGQRSRRRLGEHIPPAWASPAGGGERWW